MKKLSLLDFYKSILTTGGLHSDKDGVISAKVGDVSLPYTIKGKSLVLPTKAQLSNPNWDNKIVFHPLAENIQHGESIVLGRFRECINTRTNYVIGRLIQQLMGIATSTSIHSKLSPDQAELLSCVKNADEKTFNALKSIIEAMNVDSVDRNFIRIYLKRGGVINGVKYSRCSIVSFPLYEELLKEGKTVYGVSLRIKDKESIISLLEFMFPTIGIENSYSKGSQCHLAPSLDCIMKSVMVISSSTNDIVHNYESFIDCAEECKHEDDWASTFDNLEVMRTQSNAIPMQAGNEGGVTSVPVVQPIVQPVPTMSQVNHQGFYQPPQAPIQQMPVVQNTKPGDKIDFSSAIRSNPHLNAQFNHPAYMGGYPNYQAPPAPPRWAAPTNNMPMNHFNNQPFSGHYQNNQMHGFNAPAQYSI